MARFPFFREITGIKALVVGGGEVALRRACALADFGAEVRAVAPRFIDGFELTAVRCIQRSYKMEDMNGMSIVIAATDDRILNAEIGRECRKRGIEVNVADNPDLCTFQFPALVRHGKLAIGISADGASPVAAKYVRRQIESALPERMDEILDCMESARICAKKKIPDRRLRAEILRQIFEYCLQAEELPDEDALEAMVCCHPCTEMD